jgi:hypothetical protein
MPLRQQPNASSLTDVARDVSRQEAGLAGGHSYLFRPDRIELQLFWPD